MLNAKTPEPGNRRWYTVQAKKGETAEVLIYDEIGRGFFGGGLAAEDFINDVKVLNLSSGDELKVRINSPGGDVYDGISIHNFLRSMKAKIVVRVDGVAASIASIIAMAGDRIEMPENAMMMIHNPWGLTIGNAAEMRKTADDLDKIGESMSSTYLRRAGDKLDKKTLQGLLDGETFLSAQEAVDYGLADVVDEPVRAAALAQFDLSKYGFKVPQALITSRQGHLDDIVARRKRLSALNT